MAARKKTAKRARTPSPPKKRPERTVRTPVARKPPGPRRARKAADKLTEKAGDASTSSSPEFMKVAFTLFPVTDAKRARAFYEDVLGLSRGLASPDGTWTEYDLPIGGCLALFKHPMPEMAMKPGGASIAFEVSDLDALNERLVAAGVTYQGDIVHGPHCRMSNILDSEGNHIILHQLTGR